MSDFKRQADNLLHIIKVPGDELDHGIDWSKFLADQSTGAVLTIVTHGFTVPTGLNGIVSGVVGSHSVVRLAGGTAGQSYVVTGWVTLSNGERPERVFVVDVVARKS